MNTAVAQKAGKAAKEVKKLIRHLPPHTVEAGAALVIGEALRGKKRATHLATSIGALVAAHYILKWAKS